MPLNQLVTEHSRQNSVNKYELTSFKCTVNQTADINSLSKFFNFTQLASVGTV